MVIINFLRDYWKEILSVICMIVTLVLWLLKKKPIKVVDTIKETICRLLPYCIQEAEKLQDATGVDKKTFALSLLWKLLAELVNVSGDELVVSYNDFASEQVEVILSTPQKKGISYGKKNS